MEKVGTLGYDAVTDRLAVNFNGGGSSGGLHCGQPLDAKVGGKWVPTRVEYGDDWYLVGLCKSGDIPGELPVRMEV